MGQHGCDRSTSWNAFGTSQVWPVLPDTQFFHVRKDLLCVLKAVECLSISDSQVGNETPMYVQRP